MKNSIRYRVPILLILSAGLLAVLVPGGPIETRSFSHINTYSLMAFNTFLTVLGLGSLVVAYFSFVNKIWSFWASAACALSYVIVYALDLGTIFPVSPSPMPVALFAIEVIGIVISLPLFFWSIQDANKQGMKPRAKRSQSLPRWFVYFILSLGLAGTGIVIFATQSAMSPLSVS